MNLYERVLNHVYFTVIIWEHVKEKNTQCIFVNKNNIEVKRGMTIDDYFKNYPFLESSYKKLLDTNKEQTVIHEDENITMFHLSDNEEAKQKNVDTYYEIRTYIKSYYNNNILSHISSQTRTPLNTILGMTSLLLETTLTPVQKKYIIEIKNSSYDIMSLMNDLVDLINLGKNKVGINLKTLNLKQCVIDSLKISFLKHSSVVNFSVKIDNKLPKFIVTDEKRLLQILTNLIKYSLKNTDVNNISLEIVPFIENDKGCPFEYINVSQHKRNILFIIKDNGAGFDEDNIKYIDTILGVGKQTEVKSYQNGELNLLISKYVCNLLCGNVWFKSSKDLGTIYYFNIICDISSE
jgi:signal transduction histidine kinase